MKGARIAPFHHYRKQTATRYVEFKQAPTVNAVYGKQSRKTRVANKKKINMNRQFKLGVLLALISTATATAGSVRGYVTKNGTYVAPHYQSAPNKTKLDNYSTKGNVNPYTGKVGTKNPYVTPSITKPSR